MTKYIVSIDYKASYKPMTIEFFDLEAQSITEAMAEANKKWHEGIYLMQIYEKKGRTKKIEGLGRWKATEYHLTVERRSNGWNPITNKSEFSVVSRETHPQYDGAVYHYA